MLADVAGAGGNLLLNISPDGDGGVLPWQRERLEAIGAWMARHGEAIVGTSPGLEPGRFYGPTTRRGDRLYLLCPGRPVDHVVVRAVPGARITGARALGADVALEIDLQLSALDRILLNDDPVCDVVIAVPDEACDDLMTVIELTFDGGAPGR
jgi:alpha-L-fucosidase